MKKPLYVLTDKAGVWLYTEDADTGIYYYVITEYKWEAEAVRQSLKKRRLEAEILKVEASFERK